MSQRSLQHHFVRHCPAGRGWSDVFADATGFEGLELEAIVDFADFDATTATAIKVMRHGGTVV